MEQEQLKQYYEIFTDGWKLFKEFSEPDGSDEFWQQLIDKASQLDKQYNSRLFREISLAILNEIEKIDKEGKQT